MNDAAQFQAFASMQSVRFGTMPEAFSLADAIEMLGIIGDSGSETALPAQRMAAALMADVVIAFLRERSGHEPWEPTREPEHLFEDPANVERHLLMTSSLCLLIGERSFPAVVARWLSIGESIEAQAAFYDVLISDRSLNRVLQKHSPAAALWVKLQGRTGDVGRVRSQQACHARLLSLDSHLNADDWWPSAELAIDARVAADFAPLITKLRDTGNVRLADEIEQFLSINRNHRVVMGSARCAHLFYHLPRIRHVALQTGLEPLPAGWSPHSAVTAPPTWRWDNRAKSRVAHRYVGAELEALREVLVAELPFRHCRK